MRPLEIFRVAFFMGGGIFYVRIMMITGAGISTGSGLGTYRGKGGLYTQLEAELGMPIEQFLSSQTLKSDPDLIWKYWMRHRHLVYEALPSKAHEAIAALAKGAEAFLEVTQNVDGLSLKAGVSPDCVIELHGSFSRYKCINCHAPYRFPENPDERLAPECVHCAPARSSKIRPDVVLFGELIDQEHFDRAMAFAKTANILILCGTTLMFPYLGGFIHSALEHGAELIYIHPEASSQAPMLQILGLNRAEGVEYRQTSADEGLSALVAELGFSMV